jgi:hypothetical protein
MKINSFATNTMNNRNMHALVVTLALVSALALSPSAPAQTFTEVSVQGNAKIAQIASGGMSVWALTQHGHPYIFTKGTGFVQVSTISLTQIAVGGGNQFQSDTVWALDAATNIYQVVKSGTAYVFNRIPGSLDFIAVGIGYQDSCHPYEVWGLNPSAEIFRYDFCAKTWDQIPGTLQTISVGGGAVWGINGNGEVYQFGPNGFYHWNRILAQISLDPNGDYWGVDSNSLVYKFCIMCSGAIQPISSGLTSIQAGGDGVWGLDSTGQVWRFDPLPYQFAPIPSSFASISVGSGGGVWGIDSAGLVYAFSRP